MSDSLDLVVQSGGSLIGQGAYGCIFEAPLICSGATKPRLGWNSKKLGKLTEYSDIKNEIAASKFLGKYPDAKKYCILPEINTLCRPAPMALQKEKDLKECYALNKYGSENMMQYELEYGGKTLKFRIQGSLAKFPFFKFMEQILEIGAFLVIHGCIHNDIHGKNLVLDDSSHPRLIDFGRSYIHSHINKEVVDEISGVEYNAELGQIPPEVTMQHGVQEGLSLDFMLRDIYTKKPSLIRVEHLLGISRTAQIAELKEFWQTSRAVQERDWETFYKLYWPVVDSWAIAHNLLGILRNLLLSKQFTESNEWIQKQAVIKNVLRGMTHTSPKKRIDALEALAMYDPTNALVSGASGKAWLQRKAEHSRLA